MKAALTGITGAKMDQVPDGEGEEEQKERGKLGPRDENGRKNEGSSSTGQNRQPKERATRRQTSE